MGEFYHTQVTRTAGVHCLSAFFTSLGTALQEAKSLFSFLQSSVMEFRVSVPRTAKCVYVVYTLKFVTSRAPERKYTQSWKASVGDERIRKCHIEMYLG